MSSDRAVTVKNLTKCFQIYEKPHHRLLQLLTRGRANLAQDFWALKGISFEINRGETVGIVGRNGSGKSTLLQLICGTLNPTSGSVDTKGRIAALLELGSGFNPDFSGEENVFLNAALLGLRRHEVEAKFDDIVAFADIGAFIKQPVKTYSSGMIVRLAFAVQAQLDPDILIVDEALAVGDAKFQAKCFSRLNQLKERGASILLVTHSSEQIVSHCSQAILLEQGQLLAQGEPRSVVNRYLDLLFGKVSGEKTDAPSPTSTTSASKDRPQLSLSADLFNSRLGYNPHEYRWGDKRAQILDFYLKGDDIPFPSSIRTGQRVTIGLAIRFEADIQSPILGVTIKTKEGITIYGTNSESLEVENFRGFGRKGEVVAAEASFMCDLAPGDYFVSIGIAAQEDGEIVPLDRRYDSIHLTIAPSKRLFGLVDLDLSLSASRVAA